MTAAWQAALSIAGRRQVEQLAHALVPRCGQIAQRELARDQRLLQPIAQDDVARITNLIGLYANQARLDTGVEAAKVLGRKRTVLVAKRLPQQRSQKLQECCSAKDGGKTQ